MPVDNNEPSRTLDALRHLPALLPRDLTAALEAMQPHGCLAARGANRLLGKPRGARPEREAMSP